MKYTCFFAIAYLWSHLCLSQDLPDSGAWNAQGKIKLEAYLDLYHAYNFNKPSGGDQPYFVSMARDREVTINLAFIRASYTSNRVRASLAPGFGTYMNSNYASEPGTLRWVMEANAGVRLSANREIWLDAGIFSSPYTNEGAISKDQLAYTRSLAPEYVPYYLAGVRGTVPLSEKWDLALYLVNGWQQIQDQNDTPAAGTHLSFRPGSRWQLNWVTFAGQERSAGDATVATRLFSDFYVVYRGERLSVTSCFYAGSQGQANDARATWWQVNATARYDMTPRLSASVRAEHFSDDRAVMIVPITGVEGFRANSASLGWNYRVGDHLLVRLEGRHFFSDRLVFERDGKPVGNSTTITSNLTFWF